MVASVSTVRQVRLAGARTRPAGLRRTTVVPGKTTLDVFARDIAALADHVGIGRLVIVGLSMGGQIAMEFCRQYPQRVRGLVLAATTPQAETAEGKVNRNAMADRLLREGLVPYAEEVLTKMVAPRNIEALPAVAEKVMGMMRSAPSKRRRRFARPGRTSRLSGHPGRSRCAGPRRRRGRGWFHHRADADLMHGLLRNSELCWMPGVGHMPNLEREAEFNAALKRFLASVFAAA